MNGTKKPRLRKRPLVLAVIVALLGGLGGASAELLFGVGGRLAEAGTESARKLFESETETAVREYLERVQNSRAWDNDGPLAPYEAGRKLLLADWKTLSPYRVREHRPSGERVDLDELYRDTALLADRPVVFKAFVTVAYTDPFGKDYPGFVVQDLYFGVKGQVALARCTITRPRSDRFEPGDFLEVKGVALASGIFSLSSGTPATWLACSSAERQEP